MNQGASRRSSAAWPLLLLIAPLVFIGLAAIGGSLRYSPVPYWDMWDGYLDFFIKASGGDLAVWWAQHNEHRIVFSRLLFWIDLALMDGGSTPFLIVCNYLLAAGCVLIFHQFLRALVAGVEGRAVRLAIISLVCVLSFSWVQADNFTWGFQSGFFSAQLLPLTALYLLGRSLSTSSGHGGLFAGAGALGAASAGTMAGGVAVLPIMALATVIARPRAWRKQLVLAALAGIVLLAYFHGYQSPSGHGKVLDTLLGDPAGLLQFMVFYLGSPAFHFVSGGSLVAATVAGIVTLLAVVLIALRVLLARSRDPMIVCLLAFAGYLLAMALAVAGGRLALGLNTAFSGRYATPALMLWCALLVLSGACLHQRHGRNIRRYAAALGGLAVATSLLLLPSQLRALEADRDAGFRFLVAALALELEVHDAATIKRIYPYPDALLAIQREAARRDLSIFGHPALRDASLSLGQLAQEQPHSSCAGYVDQIAEVAPDTRFVQVSGWIFHPASGRVPHSASLLDQEGRIIGHVVTGASRPDVAAAVDERAGRSGFGGYLLAGRRDAIAFLEGRGVECRLRVGSPTANRHPG